MCLCCGHPESAWSPTSASEDVHPFQMVLSSATQSLGRSSTPNSREKYVPCCPYSHRKCLPLSHSVVLAGLLIELGPVRSETSHAL